MAEDPNNTMLVLFGYGCEISVDDERPDTKEVFVLYGWLQTKTKKEVQDFYALPESPKVILFASHKLEDPEEKYVF